MSMSGARKLAVERPSDQAAGCCAPPLRTVGCSLRAGGRCAAPLVQPTLTAAARVGPTGRSAAPPHCRQGRRSAKRNAHPSPCQTRHPHTNSVHSHRAEGAGGIHRTHAPPVHGVCGDSYRQGRRESLARPLAPPSPQPDQEQQRRPHLRFAKTHPCL
jgi:hypothetical protein